MKKAEILKEFDKASEECADTISMTSEDKKCYVCGYYPEKMRAWLEKTLDKLLK